MTPIQARDPYDWPAVLRLIQTEFAFMDGRIDPPSSMHHLTEAAIADQARRGEVWVIGAPPVACVFLTPQPGSLYLGKLAVGQSHRGKGMARALIDMAEHRARIQGLPLLELQTRVELVENHAAFKAMGFMQTGHSSHTGFARPTTLVFQRAVPSGTC